MIIVNKLCTVIVHVLKNKNLFIFSNKIVCVCLILSDKPVLFFYLCLCLKILYCSYVWMDPLTWLPTVNKVF